MKLHVDQNPELATITPEGEVDLNVSRDFQLALRQTIDQKPSKLVVDLSQVPYMDSSGVATLVDALQQARKIGSELVICGMQPKVLSIFEITRLNDVFKIVKTLDEARLA